MNISVMLSVSPPKPSKEALRKEALCSLEEKIEYAATCLEQGHASPEIHEFLLEVNKRLSHSSIKEAKPLLDRTNALLKNYAASPSKEVESLYS